MLLAHVGAGRVCVLRVAEDQRIELVANSHQRTLARASACDNRRVSDPDHLRTEVEAVQGWSFAVDAWPIEHIRVDTLELTPTPSEVADWTCYDGAICVILSGEGGRRTAVGSAVMVAPGLAVTATHVVSDALEEGAGLSISSLRPGRPEGWSVTGCTSVPEGDISWLSLRPRFPLDSTWTLRTVPLTTRDPRVGETIRLVGFRFDEVTDGPQVLSLRGDLFASSGPVEEFFPSGRDRTLVPYPAIQVGCGAVDSMSGGAALDVEGRLVGVVSRSFDGAGPATVAWIPHALATGVDFDWPDLLAAGVSSIVDIDDRVLTIIGREFIGFDGSNVVLYPWGDAAQPQ